MLQEFKQLYRFLQHRIITALIVATVTLAFTVLLKILKWSYSTDLYAAFLLACIIFLFYTFKDIVKIVDLRKSVEKAEGTYKELIKGHNDLPHDYSKFMDERILDIDYKNGIIMLNVDDSKYREWIAECSLKLKDSYCATFSHPFTIKKTLSELSPEDEKNGKVPPREVIKYFSEMNKVPCKKEKKRIFVLNKNSFLADIKNKNIEDEVLIDFFKSQNNFKLYLIDKDEIKVGNEELHNRFSIPMDSDFALFDGALTFRRIEKKQLSYFFVNNSLNTLPTMFREFFEEKTFKYCSRGFYELHKTMKLLKRRKPNSFSRDELVEKIEEDLGIVSNNIEETDNINI